MVLTWARLTYRSSSLEGAEDALQASWHTSPLPTLSQPPFRNYTALLLLVTLPGLTHAPTPVGSGMSPGLPLSSRAAPTHPGSRQLPQAWLGGDGLCFPAAL